MNWKKYMIVFKAWDDRFSYPMEKIVNIDVDKDIEHQAIDEMNFEVLQWEKYRNFNTYGSILIKYFEV